MRNGVIAIHRDGTLALMNDEAYRIFALPRHGSDVARPFSEVFRERPELIRVLSGAFEMTTLPNRAELRLKDLDRVIGYTLSQVRNDAAHPIGAVLFFKDLTQVEQVEERERLRDRLASLGEMAAGIAHELKNPLAGIEVMAGLLRRQVPDSPDAHSLLADIISEAKLANAIVVEMLEFVRPIRLQMEQTDMREVLQQSVTLAEGKAHRGDISLKLDLDRDLPMLDGDFHQLCQVFSNLLINAFEALDGRGQIAISAAAEVVEPDPAFSADTPMPTRAVVVEVIDNGPGVLGGAQRSNFRALLHHEAKGLRPRAADRPENRRRARRAHRSQQQCGHGNTFSGDAPGFGRRELVQIERHAPLWVEYLSLTIMMPCAGD